MAVTYDGPSDTITVVGYTVGTPCTFTDIWNADQAGGPWGQVTLQGTNQFFIEANLQIGDGTNATWFQDMNVQVKMGDYTHRVMNNATCIWGELKDASVYATENGLDFETLSTNNFDGMGVESGGKLYVYSSRLKGIDAVWNSPIIGGGYTEYGELRIWNSVIDGFQSIGSRNANNSFHNSVISCERQAFQDVWIGHAEDLKCFSQAQHVLWIGAGVSLTLTDIIARDMPTYLLGRSNMNNDQYFINFDVDSWTFTGGGTGKAFRQYTFTLEVFKSNGVAVAGATVKLLNNDASEAFNVTTDASGCIAEQTVSRGYYDNANGDTLQDYGPFSLVVEKTGFETYVHEDITLDEPVDWRISLTSELTKPSIVTRTRTKIVEAPPKKMSRRELFDLFMLYRSALRVGEPQVLVVEES